MRNNSSYRTTLLVGVTRLEVFFRCHPADVTMHQLLVLLI